MDNIEQLLDMKTRLTTIKGYAQLLEREIDRSQPRSRRLGAQIQELNREIERLIKLIGVIEATMAVRDDCARQTVEAGGDGSIASPH